MKLKDQAGFTLIELIMVVIILGILSAVAIPRYMNMVATAEEAAEDAVISQIKAGLETYATEKLITEGRRVWPTNPFDALETKPDKYETGAGTDADEDGEWTFNTTTGNVTHQRNDNTRWHWDFDPGVQTGDQAGIGTLGNRTADVGT
ncbi:MAG: type II secretion system protein [Candidatus Neomarinimicrobiota bacterium]